MFEMTWNRCVLFCVGQIVHIWLLHYDFFFFVGGTGNVWDIAYQMSNKYYKISALAGAHLHICDLTIYRLFTDTEKETN